MLKRGREKRAKEAVKKKRNFKGVRSPYKIDDRNFRQIFRQNFSSKGGLKMKKFIQKMP